MGEEMEKNIAKSWCKVTIHTSLHLFRALGTLIHNHFIRICYCNELLLGFLLSSAVLVWVIHQCESSVLLLYLFDGCTCIQMHATNLFASLR